MSTYVKIDSNSMVVHSILADAAFIATLPDAQAWREGAAALGQYYDPTTGTFANYADLPTAQLALAKSAGNAAIDQAHTDNIQVLQGNPTQAEKDSWDAKLLWAQAIIAAPNVLATGAAATYFTALGLTTAAQQLAWAQGVMPKVVFCAAVRGLADGIRSTAKSAVAAALTPLDVQVALNAAQVQAQAAVAQVTPQPAVQGNITGNLTGNITGNSTSNITGNVTI